MQFTSIHTWMYSTTRRLKSSQQGFKLGQLYYSYHSSLEKERLLAVISTLSIGGSLDARAYKLGFYFGYTQEMCNEKGSDKYLSLYNEQELVTMSAFSDFNNEVEGNFQQFPFLKVATAIELEAVFCLEQIRTIDGKDMEGNVTHNWALICLLDKDTQEQVEHLDGRVTITLAKGTQKRDALMEKLQGGIEAGKGPYHSLSFDEVQKKNKQMYRFLIERFDSACPCKDCSVSSATDEEYDPFLDSDDLP